MRRERALDEARERGVTGFLVPATRLDEAETVLDLCNRHPDVWCALGVHPHEAVSWQVRDETRLRELLAEPKAVAVGQTSDIPLAPETPTLPGEFDLNLDLDVPAFLRRSEG